MCVYVCYVMYGVILIAANAMYTEKLQIYRDDLYFKSQILKLFSGSEGLKVMVMFVMFYTRTHTHTFM